jgi:acyl-CoA dehydrogenase
MTEPNCGSDLKALRTTAEDKGDHYLVNGQNLYHQCFMCDMAVVAKTNSNTEDEELLYL